MGMSEPRVVIAQLSPTRGDFTAQARSIRQAASIAHAEGHDAVVTGEFALSGGPLDALADQQWFMEDSEDALTRLAADLASDGVGDLAVIVGHPALTPAGTHSAASVLRHGRVEATQLNTHPARWLNCDPAPVGWSDHLRIALGDGIAALTVGGGSEDARTSRVAPDADVLIVVGAEPATRSLPLQNRALGLPRPVVWANLAGGADDVVFSGSSSRWAADGSVQARGAYAVADTVVGNSSAPRPESLHERVWTALVVGVRDYVTKNGFPGVLLGLSGGIDSALCAVLAADAVGPERVRGVSLPSRFSSEHSRTDAADLVAATGIRFETQPIADLVAPVTDQLNLSGTAAENVQARIRAVVLMGISNMSGELLLTTGNRSEILVGYSTIYGDSAGGFAPIKDIPKTLVFELCRWRNEQAQRNGEVAPIPENTISKPPSAELSPGQQDSDTLPDYDLLDAILEAHTVRGLGRASLCEAGYDSATVDQVVRLVARAAWKRRQGAIGPVLSGFPQGRARLEPVTVSAHA